MMSPKCFDVMQRSIYLFIESNIHEVRCKHRINHTQAGITIDQLPAVHRTPTQNGNQISIRGNFTWNSYRIEHCHQFIANSIMLYSLLMNTKSLLHDHLVPFCINYRHYCHTYWCGEHNMSMLIMRNQIKLCLDGIRHIGILAGHPIPNNNNNICFPPFYCHYMLIGLVSRCMKIIIIKLTNICCVARGMSATLNPRHMPIC